MGTAGSVFFLKIFFTKSIYRTERGTNEIKAFSNGEGDLLFVSSARLRLCPRCGNITPKLFVGPAFDSGGVTGGAITSAFLTAYTQHRKISGRDARKKRRCFAPPPFLRLFYFKSIRHALIIIC
ncbi:MAG: DUF1538 family protein [Clostridia bacterium]|nr:DUF1538 family protein [Clostridia bacterium]